jgi:DNA-binding beta-propeller fold protein YncE
LAAGDAPAGLAIALNSADGTISLIDTETYAVTGKANVCKEPHHLMPTPDDKSVIVACAAANQLVFFDPHTGQEQKRIRNISDPYQLGYSPNRKWFVATSLRLDRVDIYDPQDFRLIARLPAPKTPSHMAFDDASQFVFVTLQDSNEVMAISLPTQKIAWVMPVAATPAGIVMSPDNRHLLVACMGEGVVEVIDWRYRKSVKKVATAPRRTICSQRVTDGISTFRTARSMAASRCSIRRPWRWWASTTCPADRTT